MASNTPKAGSEVIQLGARASTLAGVSLAVGIVALLGGLGLSFTTEEGLRRFYFAYLFNWAFVLAIGLGGLFFVLIQHLTRAGWSVSLRRLAEAAAATLPVVVLFGIPLVVTVAMQNGTLYRWAQPLPEQHADHHDDAHGAKPGADHADADHADAAHHAAAAPELQALADGGADPLTIKKRAYLNPTFWIIRVVLFGSLWAFAGWWYWRMSVKQDQSGDPDLTRRMQGASAPLALLVGITLSFGAMDLLMTLDSTWYSTIFGVYYFSSCAILIFALLILASAALQSKGYLTRSITTEHYHDLGKFMFGFNFFWAYVAFSQYMLLWYANIPDMTAWLARRGMSAETETLTRAAGDWSLVAVVMVFGHFLLPFVGFMSRHIKRNRGLTIFWSVWLVVFCWLDLWWLVMPELNGELHLGIVELSLLVGMVGIFLGVFLARLTRNNLRPTRDPRLVEAMAFQNI